MFSVHSLHNGIDVWCSDVLWFELHAMVKLLVGLRCFESLSGSLCFRDWRNRELSCRKLCRQSLGALVETDGG